MSSFDSHSLTLQKIILVFKRLHAPLNSVIGKRGWKYNVLQAKLHISDYSVRRAGTFLSFIHNFSPVLRNHLISGCWLILALPCMDRCCLCDLWGILQAQTLVILPCHILRVRLGRNLMISCRGNRDNRRMTWSSWSRSMWRAANVVREWSISLIREGWGRWGCSALKRK